MAGTGRQCAGGRDGRGRSLPDPGAHRCTGAGTPRICCIDALQPRSGSCAGRRGPPGPAAASAGACRAARAGALRVCAVVAAAGRTPRPPPLRPPAHIGPTPSPRPRPRFFETFSYLPPLNDEQISRQVDYIVNNGWTPCLEFADAGTAYIANTNIVRFQNGSTAVRGPRGCMHARRVPAPAPRPTARPGQRLSSSPLI